MILFSSENVLIDDIGTPEPSQPPEPSTSGPPNQPEQQYSLSISGELAVMGMTLDEYKRKWQEQTAHDESMLYKITVIF